jgi:hypothetical protein
MSLWHGEIPTDIGQITMYGQCWWDLEGGIPEGTLFYDANRKQWIVYHNGQWINAPPGLAEKKFGVGEQK